MEFDALLCAVGRVPHTNDLGLEELGIPISSRRTIEANTRLQTIYPNLLLASFSNIILTNLANQKPNLD